MLTMMILSAITALTLLQLVSVGHGAVLADSDNVVAENLIQTLLKRKDRCHYQSDQCQPLQSSTCLDVTLSYKYTSISKDFQSQQEVHEYLSRWKVMEKLIPRCWIALQPLLCTLFLPRCENNQTFLPTAEMCRLKDGPCRLLETHYSDFWPTFLKCDNSSIFPPSCPSQYKDLKFNNSATNLPCPHPLVSTEDSAIWFPGLDGCAYSCSDTIYTKEETNRIRSLIYHGAIATLVVMLFFIATFAIDWKSNNRYPAVILFYLSVCIAISCVGWMLQFWLGKDEIICRHDKTTRHSEPSSSGSFTCLLSFVLIYYFSMAALIWFINLAFAWGFLCFRRRTDGKHHESKPTYFHLIAWSIPLIFTISVLAIGSIDGSPLLGICFVGFNSQPMRIVFVIAPTTLAVTIGLVFLIRSLVKLIPLAADWSGRPIDPSSPDYYKKLRKMIIKIAAFAIFVFAALLSVFAANLYEYQNLESWATSLRLSVICSLNLSTLLKADSAQAIDKNGICSSNRRPNYLYVIVQLAILFLSGIAVALWAVTIRTRETWRRFLIKRLSDKYVPTQGMKHEIIAKAYQNRLNGRAPSLKSIHGDPIDMNLTSACSQSLSSTFINNLPQLLMRRGGAANWDGENFKYRIPAYTRNNNFHSSYSDVSQMRCSFDSFVSRDSQLSVQDMQELQQTIKNQRRKTRKELSRIAQKRMPLLRRDSDTSTVSLAQPVHSQARTNSTRCTQATSTGDLPHPPQLPPMLFQGNPFMSPMPLASPMFNMNQFAQQQQSPPQPLQPPLQPTPPIVPIPAKHRVRKPLPDTVKELAFLHGSVSEQDNLLQNTLQHKRRPDSRIPYHCPSRISQIPAQEVSTPNGSIVNAPQQPQLNPFGGFFNPLMNPMAFPNPAFPFGYPMAPMPPINPFMGTPPLITPQFGNMAMPAPGPPFGMFTAPYQVQNQCQNLEELQNLMRERAEHLQLITGVDSGSDMENILPIILSEHESDACITDGGRRQSAANAVVPPSNLEAQEKNLTDQAS